MSSDGSDFSEDDLDLREDGRVVASSGGGRNAQPQRTAKSHASAAHVENFSHHICDEMMSRNGNATRVQQDKSDRATVENVMDPRTRMILYKLVRSGFLEGVHGCISTGKEANVYFAADPKGAGVAIKVYRTSVLVFKDRERYVEGDFRFQRYCKSNPRKMVRVWAEKESRNLRRLESAGIPAPRVLQLRHHVLLMTFLGTDGWPMPRLHEASCVREYGPALYSSAISLLRDMYLKCNLVHGDFSEYNLLVDLTASKADDAALPVLFVIDVSQSVEPDHPNATVFLRRDIANVNRFFCDYVDPAERATVEDMYSYIIGRSTVLTRGQHDAPDHDPLRDAVFGQIPIPRQLGGYTVAHCSADVERQFEILTNIAAPGDAAAGDGDSSSDTSSGSDEDGGEGTQRKRAEPVVPLTKEERKANAKAVKEANRERRKTKVPKHLKKKKCSK